MKFLNSALLLCLACGCVANDAWYEKAKAQTTNIEKALGKQYCGVINGALWGSEECKLTLQKKKDDIIFDIVLTAVKHVPFLKTVLNEFAGDTFEEKYNNAKDVLQHVDEASMLSSAVGQQELLEQLLSVERRKTLSKNIYDFLHGGMHHVDDHFYAPRNARKLTREDVSEIREMADFAAFSYEYPKRRKTIWDCDASGGYSLVPFSNVFDKVSFSSPEVSMETFVAVYQSNTRPEAILAYRGTFNSLTLKDGTEATEAFLTGVDFKADLDLIGHTQKDRWQDTTTACDALVRWAKTKNIKAIRVVGHSLGGYLALRVSQYAKKKHKEISFKTFAYNPGMTWRARTSEKLIEEFANMKDTRIVIYAGDVASAAFMSYDVTGLVLVRDPKDEAGAGEGKANTFARALQKVGHNHQIARFVTEKALCFMHACKGQDSTDISDAYATYPIPLKRKVISVKHESVEKICCFQPYIMRPWGSYGCPAPSSLLGFDECKKAAATMDLPFRVNKFSEVYPADMYPKGCLRHVHLYPDETEMNKRYAMLYFGVTFNEYGRVRDEPKLGFPFYSWRMICKGEEEEEAAFVGKKEEL